MTQKQVCQLDAEGYFVGFTFADESPLEPGIYLLPGGTVDTTAPSIPEGKLAKWDKEWVYEDIPKPEPEPELEPVIETEPVEEPEPAIEQVLDVDALRQKAYRAESDPLFFKSQRGEATNQEWLDKIIEIKTRYPKETK
jgi:hypothetical protein